jgi:dTDP-4-dehydrorhamnose 3,5-epimerase
MKILGVKQLQVPEIKVIRFARFCDERGYFTETMRKSDFQTGPSTPFMKGVEFSQMNEAFSRAGTIRGLHFQWNPFMGKMVRTIEGHLVDLALDIRPGSPTFGKIVGHNMPSRRGDDFNEWIWVPTGFAHGTVLLEDTVIEYYCSGEYSPGCEAAISPLAPDIDWSLCDEGVKDLVQRTLRGTPRMADKDLSGLTVAQWRQDERARKFSYADHRV